MLEGGTSIWQIIIIVLAFCVFILPCLISALSKRAQGINKLIWFVLSLAFNWIGFSIYYFVVRKRRAV